MSKTKITIEIPKAIIDHCKEELEIPETKIPKLFQTFIEETLGFNSHYGIDSFTEWCEEDGADFISDL